MKIRYKNKRLNFNLFFGIVWAIFGTIMLVANEKMRLADYGYVVLSMLYLGLYIYEYKNQYLTIQNGK